MFSICLEKQDAMPSQGEPRDAAISFDTTASCMRLLRHSMGFLYRPTSATVQMLKLHHTVRQFLQRVSIACYAKRCISYRNSVRLSICLCVRLSVRRWHCVKTTPATIMRSSLEDSPMTLVSS